MRKAGLLIVFAFLVFFSSCARHAYFYADEDYQKIVRAMDKVLLLPVVVAGRENPYVRCPVGKVCYTRGEVLERGRNVIFNIIYQELSSRNWKVILPAEVDMNRLRLEPLRVARDLAKKYGADGVFIPYLFRYQERVGSSLAVKRTASLVMALFLYSVKQKSVVWMGDFSQTQEPLSSNLLDIKTSIRAKFRFMTVDELAEVAVKTILSKLPQK